MMIPLKIMQICIEHQQVRYDLPLISHVYESVLLLNLNQTKANTGTSEPKVNFESEISGSSTITANRSNMLWSEAHNKYSVRIYEQDLRRRSSRLESFANGDVNQVVPWDSRGMYLWDYFPPSFNCPFRERLGNFGEGGKIVCNWDALKTMSPCHVMSFGVRDDISFETDIMKKTSCKVFAFDPSVPTLPGGQKHITYDESGGEIIFKKIGLGAHSHSSNKNSWKMSTLNDLMMIEGVPSIHILKIDIEGGEWLVFKELAQSKTLLRVDQLLIELHFKQHKSNKAGITSGVKEVFELFRICEAAGLYPFSWEVNHNPSGWFDNKPWAIEYSFVRPTSRFMRSPPYVLGVDVDTAVLNELKSQHHPEKIVDLSGRELQEIKLRDGNQAPQLNVKIQPVLRKNAMVVLLRGNKEDINQVVKRNLALQKCPWYHAWDNVIFHEGDISEQEQDLIRKRSEDPRIIFDDVSHIFSRRKNEALVINQSLYEKNSCPPTKNSARFGVGYKAMCAFWYIDVFQLPSVSSYDYLLRIDADCIVSVCGQNPMKKTPTKFATVVSSGDSRDVTLGMVPYFHALLATKESQRFSWNWTAKHLPTSPYTNVMMVNLKWARSENVKALQRFVDSTQCIYSNRWGDLPLWGCTLHLLGVTSTKLDIQYYHGSHRRMVKNAEWIGRVSKNQSNPMATKHVSSAPSFNITARLNLWPHSQGQTGYLGNQMFIFQSTVAIAKVHGMRPIFARNQLLMLNDVFDIFGHTCPRFGISVVEGDVEPDYPTRNAEKWLPGNIYINPLQNTKIQTHLQNINHVNHLAGSRPSSVQTEFYKFHTKNIMAAKQILPVGQKCICLHLRFFPENHLKAGGNACPTGPVLQKQIDKLATHDRCLFVFSNDRKKSEDMVTAPCVHYVDPGKTEIRRGSGEVHPVGSKHEVARDFTALTLCQDLIITCGTFGVMAAVLHTGSGNVYWWPQDQGLRQFKYSEVSKSWISYS